MNSTTAMRRPTVLIVVLPDDTATNCRPRLLGALPSRITEPSGPQSPGPASRVLPVVPRDPSGARSSRHLRPGAEDSLRGSRQVVAQFGELDAGDLGQGADGVRHQPRG